MHFQQFGNSTKCRLTRPEHRKWASVPWPSWRPLRLFIPEARAVTKLSPLGSPTLRGLLRLAGGQILPPLCFMAGLGVPRVLLCSPDSSIFKIKVNQRRPWPGSNPTLNVYVEKGLCFVLFSSVLNENRQLWEELVRFGTAAALPADPDFCKPKFILPLQRPGSERITHFPWWQINQTWFLGWDGYKRTTTPRGPKVNTALLALIRVTKGYLRGIFLPLAAVGRAESQPSL